MNTWSFYISLTGMFTGCTFTGPLKSLQQNTPPGCSAIEGSFDHLSQRVDLATDKVIDYQPDAPMSTAEYIWEWRDKRWVKVNTFYGEQQRVEQMLVRGFALLTAAQERPLREIAVASATGATPPTDAVFRLQQIEAQPKQLRAHVHAVRACVNADALKAIEDQTLKQLTGIGA